MKWFISGVVLVSLWLPVNGATEELPVWETGLRGGKDAKNVQESFAAAEIYLLRDLPWGAEFVTGRLVSRIDLGVGALGAADKRGALLAAGVDLVWRSGHRICALEAGFRPAWLSEHIYGDDDLGGDLQFASHVGVAFYLSDFVVNYRYLHLSNAGVYDHNGGLDLHLLGIGRVF